MEPLIFSEHEEKRLNEDDVSRLRNCRFAQVDFMKPPKYLGLNWTLSGYIKSGYYIGATWLVENERAAVVVPKMQDIDFVDMFISALSVDSDPVADYFGKCYDIDFEASRIEVPTQLCQVTPLIVLHYIKLLEDLVKHGLKCGYVNQEENLNSKIRGRVYIPAHIQHNVCSQREDRVFCRYQEYTVDIPENRLLKRALKFSCQIVSSYKSFRHKKAELQVRLNKLNTSFANVSEDVDASQVPRVHHNKLFRYYAEAIRVAKMILRRYDNSITRINDETNFSPPFWIDMPRLFELYVYSKLKKVYFEQIKFQVAGRGGKRKCDFVKTGTAESLILDAKYKPYYTGETSVNWDDIQEISGYARDELILEKMGWTKNGEINVTDVPPCVVIYPEYENEEETFDSNYLLNKAERIDGYTNFYKVAVNVPKIGS